MHSKASTGVGIAGVGITGVGIAGVGIAVCTRLVLRLNFLFNSS